MLDVFNILVSNGASWGIALTLIIAGLIVSVIMLSRTCQKLDAEIQKLGADLETVKEKLDDKVSSIYDRLNDIAQDVAYIKGRMEKEER